MTRRAISLDIETLSAEKQAVVASIGAVVVTPEGLGDTFYVRLSLQEQIDAGLHVSEDTLKFWFLQERNTIEETFLRDTTHPVLALEMLRDFCSRDSINGVYTKGPAFDGAVLENLAEQFGNRASWHFRHHRCIRTLDDVIEWSGNAELEEAWYEQRLECRPSNRTVHNALEDAKAQGRLLSWFMRECGK